MASSHPRRSGAQVLIDQLRIHGTDTIFGVPGESYLAALDALYAQRNSIRFIICRQEGGAANMAEAYGKLTGKPGICFVTRGPGATNASIGLHTGFQDSTPMILLVGQVAREATDREAFQEIDYRRMFGQMAKWVAQIEDARRIPELISQAFHTALNGRPGPVVLALPEDMLVDEVEVADAGPYKIARGAPAPDDMATLRELLAAGRAADGDRGRRRLDRQGLRRHPCLRRGQRPAGLRLVPQPGPVRQPPSQLCRRSRRRRRPGAGQAAEGLRPHHRRRPAAGRGDDRRLHAVRPAGAQAEAGACPCRRRGAGPRLPGDACRSTAAWRTSPPPPRR